MYYFIIFFLGDFLMAEMSELLEKLKIRELLDKYCDGVNQRDSELWGSTWSQNAVWEIPHLDIKNEGKENIINIWTEAMKGYPFVHMIAQPGYIKINGNKAEMRSYTIETAVLTDGQELRPCGQYDDCLLYTSPSPRDATLSRMPSSA